MRVQGKVWVVTGAGGGMGRELARRIVEQGGRVAAVDRDEVALAQTAAIIGASTVSTHVLDLTDEVAVAALPAEVIAAHGAVDAVINNAGIIQPFLPVGELSDEAIDRVLDVNLMGTLRMVRAFLPLLLARPQAHLVNVSSMGGFFPFPGQTVYGASKAAVKLLTEGLYAELLDTGVRVSLVLPGAVDTSIAEHSGVSVPEAQEAGGASVPMTSAPAAARIILRGIERDRLHILVGKDAHVMNLAIKVAPGPAIRWVRRQMTARLGSLTPHTGPAQTYPLPAPPPYD